MKGITLQESGGTSVSGLPRDLEEAAASRLAFVALVAMIASAVGYAASFLRKANIGPRAGTDRPAWLILVCFALSLAMLLLARSRRVEVSVKLSASIAYAIAMCALIAVFRHALRYLPEDVLRGFSPLTLGILFFAVMVPMPPRRMAVTATLAALTDPLALLFTIARGNPNPPPNLWLWLFLPNVVAVGLAVAAARVVYHLGQAVRKARRLGSYRLVEKLGEGGMGEVWRAEHATLARPAAVKIVRASVVGSSNAESSGKVLQRFQREAKATAMLSSPHTVELYDYGVSDDGTFYYVMELLEGMDLDTLLTQAGLLEPERAVHLLLGICHSLRDAHASGVVHRDIKPANIYVCKKGGELDYVKVLDFGLARRVDTDIKESRVTIAGEVIGTPQYMAPEALCGADVDGRTDLYAVGCVAYRMLTGHDVFEEPTVMALLAAHLQKPPRPIQDLVPGVPAQLAQIVMGCLAKAPADRPASSAVLMQELQATGLASLWTPARAHAWWAQLRQFQQLGAAPTEMVGDALANAATLHA
jgi:eukaryotic-like serine/threonine-protein kinase